MSVGKSAALFAAVFCAGTVFAGAAVAALAAVLLTAAGLLSVFTAVGCMIGLLANVATDLAPPAILFVGFFCLFSALSLFSGLYVICPKAVRRFNLVVEDIFN